jgi:hypothetical protein
VSSVESWARPADPEELVCVLVVVLGGEGERVRTEGDVAAVKTDAAFV